MENTNEISLRIAEVVGVGEGSGLYDLIDYGLTLAPYIGKLWNIRKMNRLERRAEEHSGKLLKINKLMSDTILSAQYVKERVFPIVFEDLLEEHEDAKINYILTGFQNVFLEEKYEESIVINYFDTVRDLRYADLRRLHYFAGLDSIYPNEIHFEGSEVHTFAKSIDSKLVNMSLIHIKKKWGESLGQKFTTEKDEVLIRPYGKEFLNFITPKEKVEENTLD